MSTPAQVIRKLLIDLGLAPDSQTESWAPFVSFLPDKPDTSIGIYDTAGVQNGRVMRGGQKIEHPGIQIRFRSSNYILVWQKARDIADALDAVAPGTIVLMALEEEWMFKNVSRVGNILPMGVEEQGDRRRYNFTINCILTLRRNDPVQVSFDYFFVLESEETGADSIQFMTFDGMAFRTAKEAIVPVLYSGLRTYSGEDFNTFDGKEFDVLNET